MHSSIFVATQTAEEQGYYLVESVKPLSTADITKLENLLQAELSSKALAAKMIGPRRELISPWSTNASEIASNVGILGIIRIERFEDYKDGDPFDPMVQEIYSGLTKDSLVVTGEPARTQSVGDIATYSRDAGLALSQEEIDHLEAQSKKLARPFTDVELYGFGQVNSEHCRHKIFNGEFVLDGKAQPMSLFQLIKETSKHAGHNLVSAYKDNVAFVRGPKIKQFAPQAGDRPAEFELKDIDTVLALKAETHNFPTTVEPFSGASTGSGGEIRDRMAGGIGSLPLVGSAVYMTAYPRFEEASAQIWREALPERKWLYQSPEEILVKASNGASDFGNKFGQPLINGSVLTFEARTKRADYAFDKCVMQAGGVGYANAEHAQKKKPQVGDKIVVLGGDNYRIGMGGGSVSSVKGGEFGRSLELSAVQRANAEMQKRVYNVIRALAELPGNPIKLVHDHGAGGHMNCLTELIEESGGKIQIAALPVGDKTLSTLEILCNESQERMGLLVPSEVLPQLEKIAARERAPMYVVGEVDGSGKIVFEQPDGTCPVDLPLGVLLGSSPKTVLSDESEEYPEAELKFDPSSGSQLLEHLRQLLQLEGVGCKDWLTNKVDRSVTGRIAQQQCVGPLQLPLANVGVVALDYSSKCGIATALGHAPGVAIIDERAGSELSLAEALTNLIWAPLKSGLDTVALSANWMWPCKRPGENGRLYRAVEALSKAAIEIGIPIPTGKDSVSMTIQYPDGREVRSPGTVIISAMAEVQDIEGCVTPDLKPRLDSKIFYINLSGQEESPLGGSSLAQVIGQIGASVPQVQDLKKFKERLLALQRCVQSGLLLAGHDVSAGGPICALSEMAFAGDCGIEIDCKQIGAKNVAAFLFSEKPAAIVQVAADKVDAFCAELKNSGCECVQIAVPSAAREVALHDPQLGFKIGLAELRADWFAPSLRLDKLQTRNQKGAERARTYEKNPLIYRLPQGFSGRANDYGVDLERRKPTGIRAAIIREKGTNGDREMAFSMFAAGFDVRDVTMSDLMSCRETLSDVNFVVFPGGFSNSDVLGAGRGWGSAFEHNPKALRALQGFLQRPDTLSLGVCNGCQLMVALNLLYPEHQERMLMRRNDSGKFESNFITVQIAQSNAVLLTGLEGSRLGIWVAHGEGKFYLPEGEKAYSIPIRYASADYPACPNGADFLAAGVVSADGRHLAMMPHPERAVLPWQWPYRNESVNGQMAEITPWMLLFVNALNWIKKSKQ